MEYEVVLRNYDTEQEYVVSVESYIDQPTYPQLADAAREVVRGRYADAEVLTLVSATRKS